jgi:hypothetical protein
MATQKDKQESRQQTHTADSEASSENQVTTALDNPTTPTEQAMASPTRSIEDQQKDRREREKELDKLRKSGGHGQGRHTGASRGQRGSVLLEEAGDEGFIPAPSLRNVTNAQVRHDGDALTGHFVRVVDGDYEGRYGVLDSITKVDEQGFPLEGMVVTRDDDATTILVKYQDLARSEAGHR